MRRIFIKIKEWWYWNRPILMSKKKMWINCVVNAGIVYDALCLETRCEINKILKEMDDFRGNTWDQEQIDRWQERLRRISK